MNTVWYEVEAQLPSGSWVTALTHDDRVDSPRCFGARKQAEDAFLENTIYRRLQTPYRIVKVTETREVEEA